MSASGQEGSGTAPRTRHWLYSVADRTGRSFDLRGGGRATTFDDYRRALLSGTVLGGRGPLESGFLTIRAGDVLWLYGGDDLGVVGRGTVEQLVRKPEPRITFSVDRGVSRVLAVDPVPPGPVRRRVGSSIRGALSLAEHPAASDGFQWWIDRVDERDARKLEPLALRPLREVLARNATRFADPGLAGLVRALRARNLVVGMPTGRGHAVDLVGCNGNVLVAGRVVPTSRSAVPHGVLEALGPVAWEARAIAERAPGGQVEAVLWFAFTDEPREDVVEFVEDQGHSVSWAAGPTTHLGPRTRAFWDARLIHDDDRSGPGLVVRIPA